MLPRPEGPDFVGVGVHKSGTTWLAEILDQHPEVLMAKKEISFFVRYFRKGYRWYHNWFRNKDGRIAGEFTPSYLISPRPDSTHKEFYPHWNPRRALFFWQTQPAARDELKAHYPGIRVLAIFRNPVDRAWSAYWYWRRRKERLGKRVVSFEKMWADDGRWIRTQGLYAHYLAYWREAFPDFGVFFYDDIKGDPTGLARAVYRFLGVDDTFVPATNRWPSKGQYEPMPPEIRKMLVEHYREQILKFS
ncbi:MAG: sulfotransferase, partial [Pseudomonadota bacterium]